MAISFMPALTLPQILLILVLSIVTVVAAISDYRFRKIPNKLTVPVFLSGLVYQLVFFGFAGLLDGLAGFAIGFGTLFVLWIIGGGGGGDVKLMGAIGVWLGRVLTTWVLGLSTVFVIFGTFVVLVVGAFRNGVGKTREQYMPDGKPVHADRDSKNRRIMAFAMPVAVATWVVLAWQVPSWPYRTAGEKIQSNAPASSPEKSG